MKKIITLVVAILVSGSIAFAAPAVKADVKVTKPVQSQTSSTKKVTKKVKKAVKKVKKVEAAKVEAPKPVVK